MTIFFTDGKIFYRLVNGKKFLEPGLSAYALCTFEFLNSKAQMTTFLSCVEESNVLLIGVAYFAIKMFLDYPMPL